MTPARNSTIQGELPLDRNSHQSSRREMHDGLVLSFYRRSLRGGLGGRPEYTEGFTRLRPSVFTVIAMAFSFILLAQALKTIPVGTGYAVWTGIGATGTALIGILLFEESRDIGRIVSLILIVAGILGLKLTASP